MSTTGAMAALLGDRSPAAQEFRGSPRRYQEWLGQGVFRARSQGDPKRPKRYTPADYAGTYLQWIYPIKNDNFQLPG